MNITQLLKNYEKICLSFESEDEVELKKTAYDPRLQNTGRFPFAGNNPPEQNPFFYNRFRFRDVLFSTGKEASKIRNYKNGIFKAFAGGNKIRLVQGKKNSLTDVRELFLLIKFPKSF